MADMKPTREGHEAHFERNQELEFKAQARRAKLFGRYAAGLMGLADDAAEAYAKSCVLADLEEAGEEDLYRKVKADLDQHAVKIADDDLRHKMAELLDEARASVAAEG